MNDHMVTFGYGDAIYRRKVTLIDGYTTRADIPRIFAIAFDMDPAKIDVLMIDGEWV